MEISGIGGFRDRGLARAPSVSEAEATATTTTTDDVQLLAKPPPARSLDAAQSEQEADARALLGGGHRASEPILLDFDLPAPSRSRQHQLSQQHQQQNSMRSVSSGSSASSVPPATRPKRKSMPRLDNLTPTVRITETQKAELKQAAENRIAALLPRCQAAWDGTNGIFEDPKHWKLHVSKPNLSVYRHRDPSGATYHPFVATGRIPGLTLQDIEYGLYAETTPDERAINAFWFSDFFLDAAVLEAFETQTEDDRFHFFGMKWLLTGTIGGVKLISPRDNAFMQYSKTVTSELGEKILVKVVESVPENIIPFIPDQGDLRFVRSELSIIYMYHYDAKAKEVQVFCEGKIDPAGRTPSFMANLNLSLFAPIIVHLDNIADAKFITKHGLMFPHNRSPGGKMSIALSVSTCVPSPVAASTRADSLASHLTASWVPDHQRKACFVCFKSFSLLRRHRHHCRMCGEVMCSRCMVTLPLVAPAEFDADENAHFPLQNQPAKKKLEDTNRHGFPVVNTFKFCKKCMFSVCQERRAMVAGVGNYYFTEGMLRHREQMQAAFAGRYVAPFADEDGASGFPDDDETIIDDVQYSQRVEKLRQEHMEREKRKLREQQQRTVSGDARVSVRLVDDADLESLGSSSRKQSASSSEAASFDFDSLFLTDPRALAKIKFATDSDNLSAFTSSVAGMTVSTAPVESIDNQAP